MKPALVIAGLLVCAAAFLLYEMRMENRLQRQQLALYEERVSALLQELENGSRVRLDLEQREQQARAEIGRLGSQLKATSDQLAIAEDRQDPDYDSMATAIRRQLLDEQAQASAVEDDLSPRTNLLQQLATLEQEELGEVLAIQGQFGAFLAALDVSPERMEVIVSALGNLVADQNQARMQAVERARAEQSDPRQTRLELRQIMSPGYQQEALAYDLTEEELALLAEVQEQQREQRGQRGSMRGPGFIFNSSDGPPVFFDGGQSPPGRGSADALPVPPTNRAN